MFKRISSTRFHRRRSSPTIRRNRAPRGTTGRRRRTSLAPSGDAEAVVDASSVLPREVDPYEEGLRLYRSGRSKRSPQVDAKVVQLWELAAANGNDAAMFGLGRCHETGDRVGERNIDKAMMWYHRAAECGNVDALKLLIRCYNNGTGVPKDVARASVLRSRMDAIVVNQRLSKTVDFPLYKKEQSGINVEQHKSLTKEQERESSMNEEERKSSMKEEEHKNISDSPIDRDEKTIDHDGPHECSTPCVPLPCDASMHRLLVEETGDVNDVSRGDVRPPAMGCSGDDGKHADSPPPPLESLPRLPLSVKELKAILLRSNVDIRACVEKKDLIDLALEHALIASNDTPNDSSLGASTGDSGVEDALRQRESEIKMALSKVDAEEEKVAMEIIDAKVRMSKLHKEMKTDSRMDDGHH